MDFLGIFFGWCWGIVGWIAASLPPLWIADQVRNDGPGVGVGLLYAPPPTLFDDIAFALGVGVGLLYAPPPCGLRIKSAMT